MTLSDNSKFILNELELENSGLSQTNEVLPDRWDEAIVYINVYEDPASKLDKMQEMYDLLSQINSKKQEIVNICNVAFASSECIFEANEKLLYGDGKILGITTISAPSGGTDGTYSNVTGNGGSGIGVSFNVVVQSNSITSVSISNAGEGYFVGDVLTINGTTIGMPENGSNYDLVLEVSRTDEDSLVFSETGTTFITISSGTFPPIISYQPVAFGIIRKDNIRVVYYPTLENQNSIPQSNNALEGLSFPIITSGSTNSQFRGKGRSTILSANSSFNDGAVNYRIRDDDGNWSVDGTKRGSGWSGGDNILGKYYKITNDCGGRRSEINTLSNEIANLRSQINNLLSPINSLKDKKHGYQLRSWSYRRSQKVNNDTISSNDALKNLINNPAYDDIFG
jgi:regulator of replication initiation timing